MILGFVLAAIYNPYVWTAATNPRWCFLAVALPTLLLSRPPNHVTILHLIGLTLLAWCIFTLTWAANLWDGLNELIQFAILTAAFVFGARSQSLRSIFMGLAFGLSISSLLVSSVSVQEVFPAPIISIVHEGLLGNRNMLAEAAVLTLIGCIGYRLWWFIPGLLPAIYHWPYSRASIVALGAAAFSYVWGYSKRAGIALACVVCAGAAAFVYDPYRVSATSELFGIWSDTIKGLTFLGHGLGSYYTLYPFLTSGMDTVMQRPDHAHNDILELAFETGLIGVAIYAVFIAIAYRSANHVGRAVLAAFVTLGMFAFPWHLPVTGFIAALVVGHAAGRGYNLRYLYFRFRLAVRPWNGRNPEANIFPARGL